LKIITLILREITHGRINFILSLMGVTVAVSVFISFFTTGEASKRETTRLMRNIGFNLRIIPKETNMEKFWLNGFSDYTMPQRNVDELASHAGIAYAHLTATLQKKITWLDREVILTGIAPEISPPGTKKSPMFFSIEPGTIYVGFELARNFSYKPGDMVEIFKMPFKIIHILSESGSEDDIRIYGHLNDIQNLLNLENQINEIMALQCLCIVGGNNTNSIAVLRKQLAGILPDTKVIVLQSIAFARENQRLMSEKYFSFIMPFILIVCMVWVGVLALINVRERRPEIGILRALGYDSGKIAFLVLGKAVIIGIVGAAIGFSIGTFIALKFGTDIFKVTANMIKPEFNLLYWSIITAPVFTAIATFIPAMLAVTQDPADTLREE
jgi:putative ABC transport system permease protein